MRGDRPFAYDLVIEYGAVSSRVVLLLRSAEAKPRFFTSVPWTPHSRALLGLRKGFIVCIVRCNYRAQSAVIIGPANTRILQNSKFCSHIRLCSSSDFF